MGPPTWRFETGQGHVITMTFKDPAQAPRAGDPKPVNPFDFIRARQNVITFLRGCAPHVDRRTVNRGGDSHRAPVAVLVSVDGGPPCRVILQSLCFRNWPKTFDLNPHTATPESLRDAVNHASQCVAALIKARQDERDKRVAWMAAQDKGNIDTLTRAAEKYPKAAHLVVRGQCAIINFRTGGTTEIRPVGSHRGHLPVEDAVAFMKKVHDGVCEHQSSRAPTPAPMPATTTPPFSGGKTAVGYSLGS